MQLPRQAVNCFGHYCVCGCVCGCVHTYKRNSRTDTCKLRTTDFEVCMDMRIRMGFGRRMLGCLVLASLLSHPRLFGPRFSLRLFGPRFCPVSSSLLLCSLSACRPPCASLVAAPPHGLCSCSGGALVLGSSLAALVLPLAALVWCSGGRSLLSSSRRPSCVARLVQCCFFSHSCIATLCASSSSSMANITPSSTFSPDARQSTF